MKKTLSVFAVLVFLSIALIYGATLYFYGFNFGLAHAEIHRVWMYLRHYGSTFFAANTWSLVQTYVIAAAVLLIVIVDLVIFGKTIQLKKPFVNYLAFFVVILVATLGLLSFIPYQNNAYPPSISSGTLLDPANGTIPTALIASLQSGTKTIETWVVIGAIGAFIIFSLTYLILAFVDLAASPFPITKSKRTQKVSKSEREIVNEEFGRISDVKAPASTAVPLAHEIHRSAREEFEPRKVTTPPPPPVAESKPSEALVRPLSLEEIRAIIRDELERSNLSNKGGNDPFRFAPVIYAAPWMNPAPYPYPPYPNYGYPPAGPQQAINPGVTGASKEDLRAMISQELEKVSPPSKKDIQSFVEQEITRLSPTSKEVVYSIVNEELIKYDALNREALDSLVSEKVDKYDTVNKGLIRSTLTDEIKKYDQDTRVAIRTVFSEELGTYDRGIKKELPGIIDERLKEKVYPNLGVSQEKVEEIVDSKVAGIHFPKTEELRSVFNEEITRAVSVLKKVTPTSEPTAVEVDHLTEEEVIRLIDERLGSLDSASPDEVRHVVSEELKVFLANLPVPEKVVEPKKEPNPAPLFAKKAVKVVPPPPVHAPSPIVEEDDVEESEDDVVISASPARIPFQHRMKVAAKDLLANYNTIKNYLLSYGVKSRVSNTGDTFRLHLKTYIKITVAGKGLKLYLALDPKDYANSTIPVQDASHISLYVDTPLIFKVKSDLSVKRALSLIDDLMRQNDLVQGDVPAVNWAKDYR